MTLETGRGKHAKYIPVAFTEQGVAMLSSILKSDRAIAVNIQIIRIFTRIREILINHIEILHKLEKIEQKMNGNDEDIALIFEQLRRMLNPAKHSRRRIGFRRKGEND